MFENLEDEGAVKVDKAVHFNAKLCGRAKAVVQGEVRQ